MVNLLKYKHKLCKKHEEDLWGSVLSKGKFNKLGEYLASVDKKPKRVSRTSGFISILRDRKKICLYYGGLKSYELMRYCRLAKYNGSGAFSDDVVSLLERRLAVLVYRMNFVSSVSEGIAYVKAGYFLVNREIIRSPNYIVRIGSLIEVNPNYREKILKELLHRVKSYYRPIAYPKYLEVNYNIVSGLIISEPRMSEVYYPFMIENNFFYIMYNSRIR